MGNKINFTLSIIGGFLIGMGIVKTILEEGIFISYILGGLALFLICYALEENNEIFEIYDEDINAIYEDLNNRTKLYDKFNERLMEIENKINKKQK